MFQARHRISKGYLVKEAADLILCIYIILYPEECCWGVAENLEIDVISSGQDKGKPIKIIVIDGLTP